MWKAINERRELQSSIKKNQDPFSEKRSSFYREALGPSSLRLFMGAWITDLYSSVLIHLNLTIKVLSDIVICLTCELIAIQTIFDYVFSLVEFSDGSDPYLGLRWFLISLASLAF